MHIAGVLPPDAPDPRDAHRELLRVLAFPLMGLVPQPTIEDHDSFGFIEGKDAEGRWQMSVSITYTLWRNPADHEDPVNLAELDEQTRESLDVEPAWERPAWLIEGVQRLRYPMLWEAVRTSWHRDESEYTTLSRQLVDHANYVLMNQFREELGLPRGPHGDTAWQISQSAVNPAVTLEIDGVEVAASEIDTDPFVYAVGARLAPDVVTTVVIARDHLPYVRVALSLRKGTTGERTRD
ncbi:hypothetical protein [Microbacterium rhizomatis]|uniref:Uncharacterized protein n=1 Tax=Microbacterium rhizomatis TaxID=1631477 RepID=A0A5J5J071_9MICO|nr:hypothetical protein [Microbacterium rhizomatis]KAA9107925.1 hypothetical protein F6B43_10900 [Microbacterium rhizomatis]